MDNAEFSVEYDADAPYRIEYFDHPRLGLVLLQSTHDSDEIIITQQRLPDAMRDDMEQRNAVILTSTISLN